MQNKIVKLHKIESGCKKISKALKIHISTIRAITKWFQSMLQICLEEDVCFYHHSHTQTLSHTLSHTHTHSHTHCVIWVAKDLQNYKDCFNFGVRKPNIYIYIYIYIYISNSPYITTCCSNEFQEKNSSWLIQKQTPAFSVVRHDWIFKWHWLVRWNIKKSFLAASPPDEFGANSKKSSPCPWLNLLLDLQCCGPVFLPEVLDVLFRCMASRILSNTNRLKI